MARRFAGTVSNSFRPPPALLFLAPNALADWFAQPELSDLSRVLSCTDLQSCNISSTAYHIGRWKFTSRLSYSLPVPEIDLARLTMTSRHDSPVLELRLSLESKSMYPSV